MATTLDGLLDPLSLCLDAESARRLLAMHPGQPVLDRMELLAGKANEGLLNEGERSEYEALINAADIIAILKKKARRQLSLLPR